MRAMIRMLSSRLHMAQKAFTRIKQVTRHPPMLGWTAEFRAWKGRIDPPTGAKLQVPTQNDNIQSLAASMIISRPMRKLSERAITAPTLASASEKKTVHEVS